MLVGILDYGAGNIKNVCRAVDFLGYRYLCVQDKTQFDLLDQLIIPGVGAFAVAMNQLHQSDLVHSLKEFANSGKQILGICLGMQLIFDKSEEFGCSDGLGLIPGQIKQIPIHKNSKCKIPHIGWNNLIWTEFSNIDYPTEEEFFVYFVHSFMAFTERKEDVIAYSSYSGIDIPAIVQRDNIIGCQFHPEKSGKDGLLLLNKILNKVKLR